MDFLILVIGAVALVWGGVLLRKGGLLGGSLAVLLAGICFGHPFFNVPGGPIPITIDRVLFAGLLAVAIVYRQLGWTHPRKMSGADWALAAFLLVLLVSTLTHDWHVNRFQPLSQVVFFFLMPAAMYWIIRQAPISDQALDAMYLALGLFGIYLALTSIAEVRQMWSFVFPKYISSTSYVEFFGRGRGPLLNPAGSGILQGLCMLGMMMRWPRASRFGQMCLLGLMPLYALGIYSTLTRSAWIGLALGLLIVLGLTMPRIWRTAVIGALILAAVPSVAFNWEKLMSFKRDKALSAAEAAESAKLRPILAVVAWHMFLDRPLLGSGYGQYATESLAYLSDRSVDLPLEKARPYVQHNVFLSLLVDTGLLGMGLFALTLLLWLRMAWQLWESSVATPEVRQFGLLFMGFVGVWLPNAMFQDVLIIPMANMLLVFMAGVVVNLESEAHARGLAEADHNSRSALPWSVGLPEGNPLRQF